MHFVAVCNKYPEFSFAVAALRQFDHRKSTVKFHNGILDTRNDGYSPDQADAILAALQRMRQTPPLIDQHIIVRLEDKKEKK